MSERRRLPLGAFPVGDGQAVTLSVSEVCSLRARYRPSLDLELGAVWAEYSDVTRMTNGTMR